MRQSAVGDCDGGEQGLRSSDDVVEGLGLGILRQFGETLVAKRRPASLEHIVAESSVRCVEATAEPLENGVGSCLKPHRGPLISFGVGESRGDDHRR